MALFFNIAEGIIRIALSIKGGNIVDCVRLNAGDEIIRILLMAVMLSLMIFFCIVFKESLYARSLEAEVFRLKQNTFDNLVKIPLQDLESTSIDEKVAEKLNDINALSGALRPLVVMSFSLVLMRIETVAFLLWKDPFVTLSMLSLSPFILWIQAYVSRSAKYKKGKVLLCEQEVLGEAAQDLEAHEYIKATSSEQLVCDRFLKKQSRQMRALYSLKKTETMQEALSYIAEWTPRFLLVTMGAWQIAHGRMTVGDLVFFSALANSATRLFAGFSDLKIKMDQFRACLQRAVKQEPQENDQMNISRCEEAVVFSHVTFGYEDNHPILADKSFSIQQGEIVRFGGNSGCGKSTAIGLLCGLYIPWSGEICVSHASNIKDLRRGISYVSQRPYLFDGTIYENIACANSGISFMEVESLLINLGMGQWLSKQKDGLNTRVGERGCFLSGGQRKRIAIARALVKNASLLILDEATAGLDEESEKALYEYILHSNKDKTIVIVTHQDLSDSRIRVIEF